MKESEALKYFKDYNVTFKINELGLYEVRNGNISIPNIVTNDEVFTTELSVGDMLGSGTLIKFAEILEAKIEEARRLK